MVLKKGIDYKGFFTNINMCEKDVWLLTEQGDKLNLKSTLSQYVFIVLRDEVGINGIVYCDEASDYKYIYKYLAKGD